MKALFVSDLDGTLLDPEARLDAGARERLNRLIRNGLQFTVASARSVYSMVEILDGLDLRLPVIEFNGGYVSEFSTQRSLVCHSIQRPLALATTEIALSAGLSPIFSTQLDGQQQVYLSHGDLNAGQHWYLRDREEASDPRPRSRVDPHRMPEERIVCITLIDRERALLPMREAARVRFGASLQTHLFENRYNPGWYWLTFHAADATKAHALEWLAERHGFAMEQVTVFGDDLNDLPMFQAAGKGIAVANAHPEIKRASAELIGPHHENSVVDYLERVARTSS